MIVKIGTIITCSTLLICGGYIGWKRYGIYKKGIDSECGTFTQSRWETSKHQDGADKMGNKLIPFGFFIIAVTGLVLFGIAAAGGYFSGSGTSAIFTTTALILIGGYGLWKTKGGFLSKSDGLLEYLREENMPDADASDAKRDDGPDEVAEDTKEAHITEGQTPGGGRGQNRTSNGGRADRAGLVHVDLSEANEVRRRRLASLERILDGSL